MSRDAPTPWATEVLRRMQATTQPRAEDQLRVLSAVERRLGIDIGSSLPEAHAARPGERSSPGAHELARHAVGNPMRRIGWFRSLSLRAGRWGLFGLATGVCGYFWGYSRGNEDAAASIASLVSAPLVTPLDAVPRAPIEGSLPSLPVQPAPVAAAPVASTPPTPATVAPAPRPHRSQGPRPVPKRPAALPASHPGSSLRAALELLERAEASLRNGNPDFARALLDELDEKSPVTPLTEERLITRALVSCALGDVGAAREARRELERLNSDSIYRRRLGGSCAASTPTTPDESSPPMSDSPIERH
jgi:hypothetical protein